MLSVPHSPAAVQPDDQRILLAWLKRLRSVKPKADRGVFVASPGVMQNHAAKQRDHCRMDLHAGVVHLGRELGDRLKLLRREFLRSIRRRIGRFGDDFLILFGVRWFRDKQLRITGCPSAASESSCAGAAESSDSSDSSDAIINCAHRQARGPTGRSRRRLDPSQTDQCQHARQADSATHTPRKKRATPNKITIFPAVKRDAHWIPSCFDGERKHNEDVLGCLSRRGVADLEREDYTLDKRRRKPQMGSRKIMPAEEKPSPHFAPWFTT